VSRIDCLATILTGLLLPAGALATDVTVSGLFTNKAVVQIDGERWDSPEGGSRLIVQLAAGQHRIEVRKDGFRPYSTTITIRSGEPQALNVVLPPGGPQ